MIFSQHTIDKIKHGSEVGLGISFALIAVLGLIPEIWGVHIPKFVMSIVLTCFFLSFALLVASSFWATDKEKEEFKRAVKEAVQEAQKEKKSRIKTAYNEKSPLIDLEPKQIAVVHQILCNIPEENGHIRTSELVQVLRALAGRGDLDDGNKGALIAWVENLTGKAVDARNFKYDYDNKYSEKGVSKQAKKIVTEFDKLR